MTAALRAELLKIATVRSAWLGAIAAAVAIPLFSLLVVSTGGLGADDSATSGAATGSLVGLLAFGAWSAALAAGEYASGTVVVSLSTVPHRPTFLGARLAAAGLVGGAGSLTGVVTSFLVVLAAVPSGRHGTGSPLALVTVVLAGAAVAVAGTAIGILTRSTSTAIAVVLAGLLLPKSAAGLLGGLQPWVVGSSPSTVITQAVGGAQLPDTQTFPPGTAAAALAMLVVTALVAAGGATAFLRRDA